MSAGASALREAQRAELRIAEYERRLLAERARAQNFRTAGRTEAKVAAPLQAMHAWGWRLLADRQWPGSRRANIDMIHVGPGGVLVIDVKAWAEPDIVDGRLYRGQADAEDELDQLRHVAELVGDVTAEAGLAPTEVLPVMVFVGQRNTNTQLGRVRILDEHSIVPWATSRGARLTDEQVEALAQLLDERFPACSHAEGAVSVVIPEPILPIGRHELAEPETLFDAEALEAAIVQHALAQPIEDWMTFLHPEQIRLARRVTVGPARIRGAAGTGKTVVALHRAAFLAESMPGPLLVTSFVKTLPPVLAALYARLSPDTSERVEFTNLHAWASALLTERGCQWRIDVRFADAAYNRAWSQHGKNSILAEIGVPYRYWRDEIDYVIKGRGLTDYEQYAALKRVGRRTRLTAAHREIVWAIYVDYERRLREEGCIDFNDLLTLALAEVRARPLETNYVAVIADEVQDLNCQAVRLLAEISHRGERLPVIGDGQQQIYPGGYTLAEAGISVAGRSTVLRTNYRNAANILAASEKLVADDEFNDLEEDAETGRREVATVRADGQLWSVTADTAEALRELAIGHVQHLIGAGHSAGDIAILCRTNDVVDKYRKLLSEAGIAAGKLSDYTGTPTDCVKVGTVQRAKGLEFKHTLVPIQKLAENIVSESGRREARERTNRELFVAMTRARDSLWIGQVTPAGVEPDRR